MIYDGELIICTDLEAFKYNWLMSFANDPQRGIVHGLRTATRGEIALNEAWKRRNRNTQITTPPTGEEKRDDSHT